MKRNLFVRMLALLLVALALLLVALALFSGCSPLAQAAKNKPTEPTAAEITEDHYESFELLYGEETKK